MSFHGVAGFSTDTSALSLPVSPETVRKMNRMTLLVGMVGCDGVVLAADKCLIEFAEKPGDCNDICGGRKLFHLEKHKIVYGYVGDWVTLAIGRELREALDGGCFDFQDIGETLRRIALNGLEKLSTAFPQREFPIGLRRQMIVAFYGSQIAGPQLWDVRISRDAGAGQIDGNIIAGAIGGTARFFSHYFEYNRPVANLARLAAHIVLMGHKDGFIDGLDVATISGGIFHWFTEEEKKPLRLLSECLDVTARKRFYT